MPSKSLKEVRRYTRQWKQAPEILLDKFCRGCRRTEAERTIIGVTLISQI
jgi:hypothetical protein